MCGISVESRTSREELNTRIGDHTGAADIVRQERLRWLRHVERTDNDDWVSV